jgi:prephenate dehydrogenase
VVVVVVVVGGGGVGHELVRGVQKSDNYFRAVGIGRSGSLNVEARYVKPQSVLSASSRGAS